jgi:hypothetical protein
VPIFADEQLEVFALVIYAVLNHPTP